MNQNLSFWLVFGMGNIAFFIVPYIINFREDPNPFRHFFDKKLTLIQRIKLATYFKSTSDPFKINFEFSVYVLLIGLLGFEGKVWYLVGAFIGLFTWIVITYYSVIIFILRRIPVLRSDIDLAKIGLKMVSNMKYFIFVISLLVIVIVSSACYYATVYLITTDSNFYLRLIALLMILFLGLYRLRRAPYKFVPYRTVFPSINFIRRNIENSKIFDFLHTKDKKYFESFNDFKAIELSEKPNFRLLCMESYGSIFYKDKFFSNSVPNIRKLANRITDKGYFIASGLSTPPLFAGGSWKSYSTLMYGTKITDDIQYNILFKSLDGFKSYQSLFHFLKEQGYYNVLVNGLSTAKDNNFDWSDVKTVFQTDDLHLCDEMGYKRPFIKFYGGRDCLPDQFALNKGESFVRSKGKTPNSMFYMTLNSHVPFNSPTHLLDNWQDIDQQNEDGSFIDLKLNTNDESQKAKYKSSIDYSIEIITQYIENMPNEDNVIVLFGDHQPPFITPVELGLETPIHIIAKNKKLLEPFINQGFVIGLIPSINNIPIRHEAFLSLLMDGMNKAFGSNPNLKIPYKPNGSVFE